MNSNNYLQKLTEVASDNGEAFKAIFDVSLNATQQLVALNGDFVRTFMTGRATPAAGLDMQEQMTAFTQGLEHASEYFRNVNDLCIKTHNEIASVNAQRTTEIIAQFDDLFEASPLKTTAIAEVMKATLSNAGTAYEKMVSTSRAVAESTLSAATQGVRSASGAAGTSVRPARKSA